MKTFVTQHVTTQQFFIGRRECVIPVITEFRSRSDPERHWLAIDWDYVPIAAIDARKRPDEASDALVESALISVHWRRVSVRPYRVFTLISMKRTERDDVFCTIPFCLIGEISPGRMMGLGYFEPLFVFIEQVDHIRVAAA